MKFFQIVLFGLLGLSLAITAADSSTLKSLMLPSSQFDLSNSSINAAEILSGGPPKDGIPALTNPRYVNVEDADYLLESDLVVGIKINGESKAFPFRILNYHEVVNDTVGNQPVAVTFCPLTKSAITFDRKVAGEVLEFGVSGLLYNSNVLMYDRTNNGLWSQLKMKAVTGDHVDQALTLIPSVVTTWGKWKKDNPESMVLSEKTGHLRGYQRDPYTSYHKGNSTMFPVLGAKRELQKKELVIGVRINRKAKAYPLSALNGYGEPVEDVVGGKKIRIYRDGAYSAFITDEKGSLLPGIVVYWFAWSAFNPDSAVYLKS